MFTRGAMMPLRRWESDLEKAKAMRTSFRHVVPALLGLLLAASVAAAETDYESLAVPHLSGYLKVDTVNPPGNESRGVAYLAKILDAHGIPYSTGESAPGRGNLWARLPGGDEPGIVLLHHIDVVPADLDYWDFDPLSGEVKDGYIYGRGALDTKGLGILHLEAFLALKESGEPLNRDVWFVATADEEAGGAFGAGWMVEAHEEVFSDVGFLLNEGGAVQQIGDEYAMMVEVTQKVPLWLRLTAVGRPGHGSAPQVETSVTRLIRAAHRIAETQFTPRVVPSVDQMIRGLAPMQGEARAKAFADPQRTIQDDEFMLALQMEDPALNALFRNTCSITRLGGSSKINVVPSEAYAELDCRLLPDQDPEAFVAELTTIIDDEKVKIERILGFTPAVSSTETELFELIGATGNEDLPSLRVIPSVSGGFTDSHFFRDMGIVSYGYSPFVMPTTERRGIHGNNERISVENMQRGTRVMIDLLRQFTVEKGSAD